MNLIVMVIKFILISYIPRLNEAINGIHGKWKEVNFASSLMHS